MSNPKKQKALFSWSGGKDSALCLYKVLQEKQFEVVALLTTLNKTYQRISMHGVREDLLERQASSIGIPLVKIYVEQGTNEEYERKMKTTLLDFKAQDVNHVIFGDIFLENLRQYRNNNLSKVGMKGIYPLWKQNTKTLINKFLSLKFQTITCCVSDEFFGKDNVGKVIDKSFIDNLPANVDHCGEHGEFHTFAFNGPVFKTTIPFKIGEKVYKPLEIKTQDKNSTQKGFWYVDLLATIK